jgi:Zn-dependent metalloprotease
MSEKRFGRLSALSAGLVLIVVPAISGLVGGCASEPALDMKRGSGDDIELIKQISLEELGARLEGEFSVKDEIVVRSVFIDESDMAHTRVQQMYKGVPVFGGEAIVHLNRDGSFDGLTVDLVRRIDSQLVIKPSIDRDEAIALAVSEHGGMDVLTEAPQADLYVYRDERKDHLVYRVELHREDGTERTAIPIVFVDAHTGKTVWEYNNLETIAGTGTSLYSGTQTVETSKVGSTFYMEDVTKKIGTFDMRNTTASTYRYSDTDNNWNSATQKAGVDAHYGATATYDFFKNTYGRNGIDGSGGPGSYTAAASTTTKLISSVVHYGTNYNNAYWNGSYMTYGDGDGSTFKPLVSLDVAAHEMTHGITERTANLTYSNESGALNEAISDIFGAMVERSKKGETSATTNMWRIGEEIFTPNTPGDALRYMDNPRLAANGGYSVDDDPDHYSERYTGTADNGGVHINSGIVNHMFYLLAKGGTHRKGGSVTGIGPDKAAAIVYRALTAYMTASTNFAGARTAMENATTALGYTSADLTAVKQAWYLVGVGAAPAGGGGSSSSSSSSSSSGGGGSTCSHSTCVTGVALVSGCNSCATTVCAADPYCCTTYWDSVCVSETSACAGGCF